jgi:cation diffusion facilitator family transporter
MTNLRFPIYLSIAAALVTLALKSLAWYLTGSVGLASDALESLVNLFAALIAYFSLRYAAKPADATHTYGHEKIEFMSSGTEGLLIAIAAVAIIREAVRRVIEPVALESLGIGVLVGGVAALINLAVARVLLREGRKHGSIVLEADGHHLMTDVLTSAAVIGGLGLVALTGWYWIDPVFAILMGLNILRTAFGLVRRSFDGLMDRALTDAEQAQLRTTISGVLEPGTTFHALRTRRAGVRRFADCHLLVPGAWTVARAHELSERVEQAVAGVMPGLELTLHVEPIEAPVSYKDSALLKFEPEHLP